MGKINNKAKYPLDTNVSNDDYLIGSDAENSGKTKNFSVGDLINHISTQTSDIQQNNVFREIDFGSITEGEFPTSYVNLLPPFTVEDTQIVIFTGSEAATDRGGFGIQSRWAVLMKGKGTYGVGGTQLVDGDFLNLNPIQEETKRNTTILNSLYVGNTITGGSVYWTTVGYDFGSTGISYISDFMAYQTPVQLPITLSASHPTLDRIDVFVVDIPTNTVVVVEGTPSATPQEASINFSQQIRIGSVFVQAASTEPVNITDLLVFNENLGEPTEFTTSENTGNTRINLGSTNDPDLDTIAIEGTTLLGSGDEIEFLDNSLSSAQTPFSLNFRIKNKTTKRFKFEIVLWNGTSVVSQPVTVRHNRFGYNRNNTSTYQTVDIPSSEFNPSAANFDKIVFSFKAIQGSEVDGFFIDNMRLLQGMEQPQTSPTSWLELTDTTDVDFVNKNYHMPVVTTESGLTLTDVQIDNTSMNSSFKYILESGSSTGTVLSLDKAYGTFYNIASPLSDTLYTTTNEIVGGQAIVLINAPEEPSVQDASKESGSVFEPNVDMYMYVTNNGTEVIYKFDNKLSTSLQDLQSVTDEGNVTDNAIRSFSASHNDAYSEVGIFGNATTLGFDGGLTLTSTDSGGIQTGIGIITSNGIPNNVTLNMPHTAITGRTIPVSVNGNFADITGDITVSGLLDGTGSNDEIAVWVDGDTLEGHNGFKYVDATGGLTIGGTGTGATIQFGAFTPSSTIRRISGVSLAFYDDDLIILNAPSVRLDDYGAGSVTGTVTQILGVTAGGDIVETNSSILLEGYYEEGTALGDDLIVSIGDHAQVNGSTYISIDDAVGSQNIFYSAEESQTFESKQFSFAFRDLISADQFNIQESGGRSLFNISNSDIDNDAGTITIGDVDNGSGNKLRLDASAGEFNIIGYTTSFDQANGFYFNGTFNTTINNVDATASRTITFPDATGTVALTSDIPTVDDTAYAASWDANTDAATKNAIYDEIETIDRIHRVKIALTATNINNIGTTPIEAIAASGAGTYIKIISCDVWLTWGSVAFDNNDLNLETVGATNLQIQQSGILNSTANINGSTVNTQQPDMFIANAAVNVTGTDSVATGDSTVDMYITYEVITL